MNPEDAGSQTSAQTDHSRSGWHVGEDLTPLEEEMRGEAAAGKLVDRGAGPFGLAAMQAWDEERTIRAAVLRYLLTSDEWPVDAKGVRLQGVRISGQLDLEATVLRCGLSLNSCFLDDEQPVCLDHASVPRLSITRCQLAGLTGEILTVREVDLSGSTLTGPLRLIGADITSQLICRDAKLSGRTNKGAVLIADGMKAESVFLNGEFVATGAVRLSGANITGQLNCRGAHIDGEDANHCSLVAFGMRVDDDVLLDQGFKAAGTLLFQSARIGGSVWLKPEALAGRDKVALNATGMQVSDLFVWEPAAEVLGQVKLAGAAVGQLEDNWAGGRTNGFWPTDKQLHLDGFTYGRFGGNQRVTMKQRLKWIRSQYGSELDVSFWKHPINWWAIHHHHSDEIRFASQPYEQLAAVYRQTGEDSDARKVAIARRADLRRYGNLNPYRKTINWLLDQTIRYGYQSWRAGVGLALVFVIFWALSCFAQDHHLIEPVGNTENLKRAPSATQCTSDYPCFYPAGYAVDTVVPLINVHQAANWGPDGSGPGGAAFVVSTWIATGLGWALATLLVAGYTGLVRQD